MIKELPIPIDHSTTERLNCTSLTFSGVNVIEGLRPFVRLSVTLSNGYVVWTDVDFDTEEAAFQMHKGLLTMKMHADATAPLTNPDRSSKVTSNG